MTKMLKVYLKLFEEDKSIEIGITLPEEVFFFFSDKKFGRKDVFSQNCSWRLVSSVSKGDGYHVNQWSNFSARATDRDKCYHGNSHDRALISYSTH